MSELEDIFKENLKDYNVNPTDNVWKGIKSNLWYSDIQNVFRNFSLQPNNSVWRAIAFRLWFKKFITYSPATFNIYYLFSVVLIGFSSFYFYNQSQENFPKLTVNEISDNEMVIPKNNTLSSRNPNLKNFQNQNSEKSFESDQGKDEFVEVFNTNQKNSNIDFVAEKTNEVNANLSVNENLVVHKEPILINDEKFEYSEIRDNSNLSLVRPIGFSLNPDFYLSEFLLRDIPEFKNRKIQWSLEGFVLPMTEKASYKVDENKYPGFGVNYRAENPSNSFSAGLLTEAKINRVSLQTGITFSNFVDRPNYQTSNYIIDTMLVNQIIPGGYYNYFSIPIFDLDTYLSTGDSVFINVLDSNFISQNDTLVVQQISAKKYTEYKRTSNSYSYIELPLIAGYTFQYGKVNLTIRGGVIAGLLTYSSGDIPSPYSEQGTVEIIQNTQSRRFVMSGIAGVEIGYNVSSRISFVTSPVYRINLNSVLKNDYVVDQRFKSFGVKFGIKYHL